MSSLAGLFLFKTVPFGDVAPAPEEELEEEFENTVGAFGRRRRKGEEGEEEEEEGEEQDDAVPEPEEVVEIVDIIEGFVQKREEEGENTGEFETATEQDMFFSVWSKIKR